MSHFLGALLGIAVCVGPRENETSEVLTLSVAHHHDVKSKSSEKEQFQAISVGLTFKVAWLSLKLSKI